MHKILYKAAKLPDVILALNCLADLRPGAYLSIVLKHLIALHVVALEHEDGSVEAGDVQTQVICSYFFIGSVREHLGDNEGNITRL